MSCGKDGMCGKCKPRLENILNVMRNQNDGATIHEVNTIRHLATQLISLINNETKWDEICSETDVLQKRVTRFYQNKYFPNHKGTDL